MVLLAIGVYSLSIDSWDVNDWEFINGLNKPDSFKTKSIFEDFNINEVTRNKVRKIYSNDSSTIRILLVIRLYLLTYFLEKCSSLCSQNGSKISS